MEIIFHSRWLACKITRPHQCCGAILVGCGAPTPQWFSEAVQACHCKLGKSSVLHNHNNKNRTSTTGPWPTDSNHCHDNNICMSVPRCVFLFFHDCGIITMAIPHCALTFFHYFTQISPCPSLLCTSVDPHYKNRPRHAFVDLPMLLSQSHILCTHANDKPAHIHGTICVYVSQ